MLQKSLFGRAGAQNPAQSAEGRAKSQALDSAYRSFHFGNEAAGRMSSADRAISRIFGASGDGELSAEEHNRKIGAALGVSAKSEDEIAPLVASAYSGGLLAAPMKEGEAPENSTQGAAAPENGTGAAPAAPPSSPEPDKKEGAAPKSENDLFDKGAYEIFGRP